MHNLFENARLMNFGAGTFINGATGGTANGMPTGQFQFVSAGFCGTAANNGTINIYACTNAGGSNPTIISTLKIGSADGAGAMIDINANALNEVSPGTSFSHLGMYGTIESGGTWRGAFLMIGWGARSAPPGTSGLFAYGSYLA